MVPGAIIPSRWRQRSADSAIYFHKTFISMIIRRILIMNETTKEQIQQSMAAYSTLLKHTGRWWLTWLFSSHYLEVFITWTWETTWSAPCRPSARCVLSSASKRDSLWCLQKDSPPPVGQQKFILQRRYLSNDEESDQGYGRIRRDADQNRRLIPIYHQHL